MQGEGEQGGLVGTVEMYDAGTGLIVTGCRNEGTVTSPDGAGGLFSTVRAGSDTSVQISDCENTGTVSSDESCVGGVVNTLFVQGGTTGANVLLQNCRNSGQVTGCGYGVGGLWPAIGQDGRRSDRQHLPAGKLRKYRCRYRPDALCLCRRHCGVSAPSPAAAPASPPARNSGTVQLYADQPLEDSGDGQQYVQGVIGGIVACAQASTAVQDCSNTGSLEIPQDLASLGYAGDLVGYTFSNGEPILGATAIQDGKGGLLIPRSRKKQQQKGRNPAGFRLLCSGNLPVPFLRFSGKAKLTGEFWHYRCSTRSLISWVRPWFQNWVPM